ncbi:MAG: hypothetical protein DRN18_01745 [Thermoplasmata archaeon]|nr:MAG: hypothetical protein DRN18_01745 [Thermoplasmata archaeon]
MRKKNDLKDQRSSSSKHGGGERRDWERFFPNGGWRSWNGEEIWKRNMVGLYEQLRKFNRLSCPIRLNPKEATFDDVAMHALLRQRLSPSTVEKNLRYARFMETHPVVPVDFRNPNYENFIRHMDYREQVEGATPYALKHEWDTMRMFLRAYGIPIWDYKLPVRPKSHKRILPYPDIVNNFFNYRYSDDEYENALYQYLFFHSFLIGWRVPSEIVKMTVDDVIIDGKRGYIIITETKKHESQRTLIPEPSIMTSKVHKSFKNWIDYWRPKVENQYSGDALYLQPSGKPFTVRHLGHKLSEHGKKVWKFFQPYDMRHWCAVARLIKTKVKTGSFDVYAVKNWLGHEKITTTESYIRYAEQYYQQLPIDWIAAALKPSLMMAGKSGGRGDRKVYIDLHKESETNRTRFLGLLTEFSPYKQNGPAGI